MCAMVKFGVKNKKMKESELPTQTKAFIKTANAKVAKEKANGQSASGTAHSK